MYDPNHFSSGSSYYEKAEESSSRRSANEGARNGSLRHTQQSASEFYPTARPSHGYGNNVVGPSPSSGLAGRTWSYEQPRANRSEFNTSNRNVSNFLPSTSQHGVQNAPSQMSYSQYVGGAVHAFGNQRATDESSTTSFTDAAQSSNNNDQTATATPDRKVSCMECRTSKVKCTGPIDDGACSRCRKGRQAVRFKQHSRGRKPAQAKIHNLERYVGKLLTALNDFTDNKFSNERAQVQEALESVKEGGDDRVGDSQTRKRGALASGVDREGSKKRKAGARDARADTRSDQSTPISSDDAVSRETVVEAIENGVEIDVPTEDLGQPALSNPLKLLAHASDVALAGSTSHIISHEETGAEARSLDGWDDTTVDGAGQKDLTDQDKSSTTEEQRKQSSAKVASKRIGASQRGYWDMGIYSTRPDKGPQLDPVSAAIVPLETARTFFDYFMRHLNAPITLLDPILHTFEYVQSHSAFLLSTACALAARFTADVKDAERLANELDAHIQNVLLPAVLLRGYRSVEIAQAFIILAAYHSNTQSLDGDRSWSLVGYGIRIAAELDMNARIMSRLTTDVDSPPTSVANTGSSTGSPKAHSDELSQRRLRNRERTWCNLWLYDFSLSTHMGRRSTLGQDPVILGVSAGWQRVPFAIPGDEAIVALIGLRRIQLKNAEFFDHSILTNAPGHHQPQPRSSALAVQLDFYNKSCASDIDSWKAMYVNERGKEHNFRTDNLCLYASYARLMLNSYALKCTKDAELLATFYKESYCAVMTYLTLYAERMEKRGLTHVHNSSVVTVAYVAVFALKLCSLDRDRFPYIDVDSVYDHVRRLIDELRRAGSVTAWRNGAASSYAPYLAAILHRVERSTQAKGLRDDFVHSGPNRRSSNTAVERLSQKETSQSPQTPFQGSGNVHGSSQATDSSNGVSFAANTNTVASNGTGVPPTVDPASGPTNFKEATTFFAGPSGVEAYTIDNLTFSDESFHFGPHDLQQLESLGFNEASLFSDMSVFLNASFNTANGGNYDSSNNNGGNIANETASAHALPIWPISAGLTEPEAMTSGRSNASKVAL